MKVLLINDFSTLIVGAERFLENLLQETASGLIAYYRLDIADLFSVGREKTSSLSVTYNRFRINAEVVRVVREKIAAIQPDIIHLNNNNLFTNSITKSLQHVDIPVLYFIHDAYALKRLQSIFFLQSKDPCTFVTHSRDIYKQLIFIQKNSFLVKVPFNHGKWSASSDNDLYHLSMDLLYVGRIEKAKGIFKLIKALEKVKKKIPSIILSILGEGSQRKAVEKMVKAKKLTPNIQVMGFQHVQELLKYYGKARILVFPSDAKSLGYGGLEAQSCGIPVITFDHQGARRWYHDNQNGFMVHGRSSRKLANKVMEIIHDDVLLTRISSYAREHMEFRSCMALRQALTSIYKVLCP